MASVREHLCRSVREAARFDKALQVAPACILWTDGERQWETAIPALQADLPELLVLGPYDPAKRTGPAVWLRCAIERLADDIAMPEDRIPILYVPGFSRQDLRAIESCPEPIVPLAELQYRGTIWSQVNGKDWTIVAYLKSGQGGLGLDVAADSETRRAAQLALYRLIDQDVSLLTGKRLDRDAFSNLLTGGDTVRDLLLWIDDAQAFQAGRPEGAWQAFVQVCKSKLAFDPATAGVLEAAANLAGRKGPWAAVWERYREAPAHYQNVPERIRQCAMPPADSSATEASHGGWPQWNESREDSLRADLSAFTQLPEHEAPRRLLALEKSHAGRRSLVWADIGEAPLARAVQHLAVLAEVTGTSLSTGTVEDLAAGYSATGWKADAAVLDALSRVDQPEDIDAVTAAIRAVYMPWAEDSARHLQEILYSAPWPGGTPTSSRSLAYGDGECLLFVDGLRFDVAMRLSDLLRLEGCTISLHPLWAALPTLTATGKPAASPVRTSIVGKDATADFEPVIVATGQPLKGGNVLRKLLTQSDWTVLDPDETGDGQGKAWSEIGNIDHEGHEHGRKVAGLLDGLLFDVRHRVLELLGSGWKTVRVVTDHGWLLMPGGLPKIELPAVLAENKWGRCAVLKQGAAAEQRLFSWYWNPDCRVAIADGIHCFRQGLEYAHGGLSLQEALTLEVMVSLEGVGAGKKPGSAVHSILWKGLRCTVTVSGTTTGIRMDIRLHAGDAASSILKAPVPVSESSTASVLVEDEDLEGRAAIIVLLDSQGGLVAQASTVVGGGTR